MSPTSSIRTLIQRLFGRPGADGAPFAGGRDFLGSVDPGAISPARLDQLAARLSYTINEPRYFIQALTHRSYLQIAEPEDLYSNERLEFLGDSILNMLVGEFLFRHYVDVQEGELTKLRSRLVNKKALIIGARELNLGDFVLLNTSAEQSLKQGNESILADTFEAIMAAIYLDSGQSLDAVKAFLAHTLLKPDTFQTILDGDENYKSSLLERVQGEGHSAPEYRVVGESGPDHERVFTIEVYVHGQPLGRGQGRSKKQAEQEAAAEALELIASDGLPRLDDPAASEEED